MEHRPLAGAGGIAPSDDFIQSAKAARAPACGFIHDAYVNARAGGYVLIHLSKD